MLPRYLVDANLPTNCPLWQNEEFIHVIKLDPNWSDSQIWEYALKHSLTIVTKDADFSNRILFSTPPPKVIHIKCGNMRLYHFNRFIEAHWADIEDISNSHKLVNVYQNKIEGIDS
jgi:predicted nuclease of predicted toxin-antitoxin system